MFDTQNFREKMATLDRRHEELGALLGTAEVINKRAEFLMQIQKTTLGSND